VKILFIKEKRSKSGIEGVGVYLLNLCIELNRLNVQYLILYNDKDDLYDEMVRNAVNVKIVPLPSGSVKNLLHRRKEVEKATNTISSIVNSENITHINVHFPHLLNYISKDINIPVVAHWHGAFVNNSPLKYFYFKDILNARKLINNVYRKKYIFNFDRANLVICSGKAAKNTAVSRFQVPDSKISINPYGIREIDTQLHKDIRKDLGLSSKDRIVLSVGRETKSKGVEDFCEVAKALSYRSNVKFIFLGGTEDKKYHNSLQKKYGNYVSFLGMRRDVYSFYRSSDIFLFLSHRESAGLVLAEAMFFGLPLIAWNIIGVNEMYEDKIQGKMERFGDITSIINDVGNILDDDGLYAQFSKESEKRSRQHTIKKSAQGLIDIFNSQ